MNRTVQHSPRKFQAHEAKSRAYCLVLPSLLSLLYDPKDGGYVSVNLYETSL
jgi:hypothetical protein